MNTTHLRSQYRPFEFAIPTVELLFHLEAERTTIANRFTFKRHTDAPASMTLHGEHIELIQVSFNDDAPLSPNDYTLTATSLTLHNPPASGTVKIITTCTPSTNTSLSGLFATGAHLMTQCEAEGFRRMTFFADRPDVLSTYTVQLVADKTDYPVLLSNGNLIAQADLDDNEHSTTWHDPFPKPSYLFALVAGQLACLEETIEQRGLRKLLQVYVEAHDLPKAQFAMDSLKASIAWDEARFGLPLDLERFMIVATSDFNMGAMENKGLNIFNSKFVLAHPDTATDMDYDGVEAVIGHEYFHNWTGNRVTCQDWFQLSLKEGLTVYRDQEFSRDQVAAGLSEQAAISARAVRRIDDVAALRSAQFAEDNGPMAHPIRPNAYEEINNFYTMTVYEKGAEVVRMYETLLGRDGFRRGMDLYFERHDGQAVTCDDFRAAMADANGADLDQFGRWYEQAGTPTVRVTADYDVSAQTYTLHFAQSNPAVGVELLQADLIKAPLHIPLNVALIGADNAEQLVELNHATQSVVFSNIAAEPIPSINRNFSAPVHVEFSYTDAQLCELMAHDTDAFNRWDATQQLFSRAILNGTALPESAMHALSKLLNDDGLSPAYRAQLFTLPSFAYLSQQMQRTAPIDPNAISDQIKTLRAQLAHTLRSTWQTIYTALNHGKPYAFNGARAGERALKNLALGYLSFDNQDALPQVQAQYHNADNMTDRFAALGIAVAHHPQAAGALIATFYQQFEHEALVIDKWFAVQAANGNGTQNELRHTIAQLQAHPAYARPNPNRIRALVFAFCIQNPRHFHAQDGSGYEFWADQVLHINATNPQVASRLARTLEHWRTYAQPYQGLMQKALQRVFEDVNLSQDVREIVGKALG